MAIIRRSFEVPYGEAPIGPVGLFSNAWQWFFREVQERLYALGQEMSFDIENNQGTGADVVGLKFNRRGVSQATIDYLIQRVTTGTGAIEKIQSGILIATYMPTSEEWELFEVGTPGPDDAGVTFSITASGQVQYTSTEETGDPLISKLYWRARTIAGKNALYSAAGAR